MNGQQNPPQNQQQPQQHDPVDPANRPLHNGNSSIRDTIGLKSSEILNWLMLILMPVNKFINSHNIEAGTAHLGPSLFFHHYFGKYWPRKNIMGSFR
jgi:hypothetical protein